MIKTISALTTGTLLAATLTVQAGQKTGGDEDYYIDTRGSVKNSVVVDWHDAKTKGGDAHNGSMQSSADRKVYYVAPVPKGGDNKMN